MKKGLYLFACVLLFAILLLVGCATNEPEPPQTDDSQEDVRETIDYYSGEGTQQDPYLIQSADDLIYLATITNAETDATTCKDLHFRLETDIDLNGMEWLPIGGIFSGNFDGNGHTISNFKLTNETKADRVQIDDNTESARNIGFFANLENASVSDLTLSGCSIVMDSRQHGSSTSRYISNFFGCMAGVAHDTVITNCKVLDSSVVLQHESDVYVGGLVAFSRNGSISKCETQVDITVQNHVYYSGMTDLTKNVGGVVGFFGYTSESDPIKFKLEECTASGSITVEDVGKGSMQVGGIVGETLLGAQKGFYTGNIIVNDRGNAMSICAGGIAGSADIQIERSIENCIVNADIVVKSEHDNGYGSSNYIRLGGIAGTATKTVKNCAFDGEIYAYTHEEVFGGGICGSAGNCKVENCIVKGDIKAICQPTFGNPHCGSGGILGNFGGNSEKTNGASIKNCSFLCQTGLSAIGRMPYGVELDSELDNCYSQETVSEEQLGDASFFTDTLGWNAAEWDNLGNFEVLPTPKR